MKHMPIPQNWSYSGGNPVPHPPIDMNNPDCFFYRFEYEERLCRMTYVEDLFNSKGKFRCPCKVCGRIDVELIDEIENDNVGTLSQEDFEGYDEHQRSWKGFKDNGTCFM